MKITIKNNNNYIHTVCRTSGQKIMIKPNDFVVIDTDNEFEMNYWQNLKKDVAKKVGIEVFIGDAVSLRSSNNNTESAKDNFEYTNISIVDDAVSPIAKQIAESLMPDNKESESNSDSPYSEEQLLQMPKDDLINICNNFNIRYRKNSSVKTLVKLILGSGVL
jgi:hypothetical protein